MEVTTETTMSGADEPEPESGGVTVPTAETSDELVSSDLTPSLMVTTAASPAPASQSDSGQTHVPTCQPEAPETGTASH